MINKYASSVSEINDKSNPFGRVGNLLGIITELNKTLQLIIPQNLAKLCHIGAIDLNKSMVVIFVHDQQVYHLVYNIAQKILHGLNQQHFKFDNILIKVGRYSGNHNPLNSEKKEIIF